MNIFFCNTFVVFYTAILHIWVFITCSTSCCLYDTLMDPWNEYIYMYVCVCMYVIQSFLTRLICCRLDTDAVSKFSDKVTFCTRLSVEDMRSNEGIPLHLLNLSTRWWWVVSSTIRQLPPTEGSPPVHTEYGTGWATELIWMLGKKGKFLASTGNLPTISWKFSLKPSAYVD